MTAAVKHLHAQTSVSLGAYANGMGHAGDDEGWLFEGGVPVETYLRHVEDWVNAGALLIGGCCGTTPAYIQMMREKVVA